ncbi:MAG: transporter substrate-binding domain-containing protein [Rhodobiaceae bacterium]|nr:transporter substrate-binding domain-containing protein [Rhodobiaceae bacterium]
MMGSALDHKESLGHSPPMRWLLLINLLAVVLLSGAVAIVIEGTPVGTGPSNTSIPALDASNMPLDGTQEVATAQEQATVFLDEAAMVTADATTSEPEGPSAEREAAQTEPVLVENDSTLVSAPDAPIPLPAPRTLETETVEAVTTETVETVETVETAETAPPPIAGSDAEQNKSDEPVPLVVATEGDFAPFNYVDDGGNPAGFDIDVAKELCDRLQRPCVYEVKPWADLMPSLRKGDIDLIAASMRIPAAQPQGVLFSSPYYGSRGRFVTSKGSGIAGPGLLRAPGSQIAVQRGSIHEAYLQAQYAEVDLVRTRSLADALQQLADGKVEAAFGDNAAVLQWMKEHTCCTPLGNPITDKTFFGEGVGLVVREDDRSLVDALNAHLQSMREDGTNAILSERYFGGSIF